MSNDTKKSSESGPHNESNAPMKKEEDLRISFQTFGEETSVPIDIRKASFAASNPVPFLGRFLASLELSVVNTAVRKSVAGKLRITLPVGSTVKRFEVLKDEKWYPAVAVPKKKAKEIVHREKEKGRDVASVSDVASGSNSFEIEVSPLPFEREVKCRLECAFVGDYSNESFRRLARSYFADDKTEVIITAKERETQDGGGGTAFSAAVGESFGKTHFVCRVPPPPPSVSDVDAAPVANSIGRIAVVWDTSGSMAKQAETSERCDRLSELARECKKQNDGAPVSFELYTFSVGDPNHKGTFESADELTCAVRGLEYDGGTDVTRLSSFFLRLSERQEDAINSALVFTDGIDNLGQLPPLENLHSLPFPVHVVADSSEVNLRCARAIASMSPHRPGSIFLQSDDSYVPGILFPRAVLRSVTTDQSKEAFLEEVDDGFRCLPDHRLGHLNEPIGKGGLLISGILVAGGEVSTVSKIVAEVAFAGQVHKHHFRLRAARSSSSCDDDCSDAAKDDRGKEEGLVRHYHHEVLTLDSSVDKESSEADHPARLLGHIYAEERYRAAESFGFKSGMDLKDVQEELSIEYGFCGPESSLLMLYAMEQFQDNGILPPKGHPLFTQAQEREKGKQETPKRGKSNGVLAPGDIGGPKTIQEQRTVVRLANQLNRYMSEEMRGPAPGTSAQTPAPAPPATDMNEEMPGPAPGTSVRAPAPALPETATMRGMGDGIPRFDCSGAWLSERERQDFARRRGLCYPCGRKTHKSRVFGRRTPLNNENVFQGICLTCHPEQRQTTAVQVANDTNRSVPSSLNLPRSTRRRCEKISWASPSVVAKRHSASVEESRAEALDSLTNMRPTFSRGMHRSAEEPRAMRCSSARSACHRRSSSPTEAAVALVEESKALALDSSARTRERFCASREVGTSAREELQRQRGLPENVERATACCMMEVEDDNSADASSEGSASSSSGPCRYRSEPRTARTDQENEIPCMDHPVVASPKDPKSYMEKIEESLKREGRGTGGWRQEYHAQKALAGNFEEAPPSFYLNVARLALKYGKGADAIRIATNCLEMHIEDVQMLRCVAYFLMSTKLDEGLGLARRLLDKVRDLQPCEPQSFLDSALVRFWALASREGIDDATLRADYSELEATVTDVQDFISHVLTHRWAARFDEVEWPALILLHYVADYVKGLNEKLKLSGSAHVLPEWPAPKLAMFQHQGAADPLRCLNFDLALMIWCGWDTDRTDVDLHVVEPTKNEVYYGNRNSIIGGYLSRDFTQGMGPEVYVLKHREEKGPDLEGTFDVYAKYFASHQDSALTGTTSVLLWTARKDYSRGRNEIDFDSVRLDTHKEKTKVKAIQLERMCTEKKTKLSK